MYFSVTSTFIYSNASVSNWVRKWRRCFAARSIKAASEQFEMDRAIIKMRYYFLEGNSCVGSTERLHALGLDVTTSNYFGRVNTIAKFIEFAQEELRSIPGDVIIIGSSFGGHLAIRLADCAPDNVRGIVLAGTPPSGLDGHAFNAPAEQIEAGSRSVLELLGAPGVMTLEEAVRFIYPTINGIEFTAEDVEFIDKNITNLTKNYAAGATRAGILPELFRGEPEMEILARVAKKMPIMMLHSMRDPVINGEYVARAACVVGAKLVLIDAPHYSHWTHPVEFMAAVSAIE